MNEIISTDSATAKPALAKADPAPSAVTDDAGVASGATSTEAAPAAADSTAVAMPKRPAKAKRPPAAAKKDVGAKKAASPKAAKKAVKAVKAPPRLVRDSFTMPEGDFALIASLKSTALVAQRSAKKSELLRAGLHALAALSAKGLVGALDKLEPVKTGRPKKAR